MLNNVICILFGERLVSRGKQVEDAIWFEMWREFDGVPSIPNSAFASSCRQQLAANYGG